MFSSRLTSLGFTTLLLSPAIALAAQFTLTPIPLQTLGVSENARTITVGVSDSYAVTGERTYTARIVSFGHGALKTSDNDYRNWGGLDERWVASKDGATWYFITPDGSFHKWNNSGQDVFTTGPVLAKFPASFHADLSLLISHSTLDVQADGTVSVKGNELTVTGITGNAFGVEVTAEDASGTKGATTFGVARLTPILSMTSIPLQILAQGEDKKLFTLEADNINSAQNTYQARIVSFGHGALKKGDNDHRNWGRLDERWVMGNDGTTWYFITPDGSFYKWNSSGQEAFTTGPVLAKFPASFHADISLLVNQSNAEAQADGSVSVDGNKLTVNSVTGKPFGVEVTANSASGNKGTMTFGVIPSSTETSLFISIDGPISRIVSPDDKDIVLANVLLTAKNGNVDIKKLPILIEIEAQAPLTGQDVFDMTEDYELRNVVTGQSIKGRRFSGGLSEQTGYTFETVLFENVSLVGTQRWELRADMRNNGLLKHPLAGDKIRAKICAESSASTTTCNFGGTVPVTDDQKIVAFDLATNKPVPVLPGGIVAGNIFSVARARLDVTVKATGTSDTASKNQKNINLLRFEARVSETEDTLLYRSVFQAQAGSLSSTQNYTLWVDTNNDGSVDTILQKEATVVNDLVDFNSLAGGGYILPKEKAVIFEVHADVANTLTSSQLQLMFATSAPKYVGAQKANDGAELTDISTNGSCAGSCQIFVTTTDSTVWNFVSQGNLYVTKSSTPVRSRQLLGGSLTDEILRLQFLAEYEDIDVTQLVFTADGPDASVASSNINRIELYKVGEVTPFATATVGGCGTSLVPANSFCANTESQQLVVQKGANQNVLVRTRMRTDTEGAVSGKHIQLKVDAALGARARGYLSSSPLSQNDGDSAAEGELFIGTSTPGASTIITGNDNTVVLSKILSITNASFDANGTAIPVGFAREVGRFKFSAAAANNFKNGSNTVTFDGLIFSVSATNVDLNGNSFKLFNVRDPFSPRVPCTSAPLSGSEILVTCQNLTSTDLLTEIDPGNDTTFALEAEIRNPQVNGALSSVLQVSLKNFSESTYSSFGPSTGHIQWLDKDGGSSTQFFWIESPESVIQSTRYSS